jgi:peptide/nickel transport system permease protein
MRVLSTLRGNPKVGVGAALLLVIVLVGVLHVPIVTLIGHGRNPLDLGYAPIYQLPGHAGLLGTDQFGRDELALLVTGLWTSLEVGFLAGVLGTLISVLMAFVAAYVGGVVDTVLATVTDLFMVLPYFSLLIAFASFAGNISIYEVAVILAVFGWAGSARRIRSQVLSLRTRAYVDLARVNKESVLEIIFFELVPNMLPYLALGLALSCLGAIGALVGLEVIGLGPTSTIDLGLLLDTAISNGALSLGVWPAFIGPIFLITALFFSLMLIFMGLEEVSNPRLRTVAGG